MKRLIPICLIAFSGILLPSCKKDHNNAATGPFLYVGGSTSGTGVYWKTSLSQPVLKPVPNVVASSRNITSIVSSGNTIYKAGQIAGYWKNDSFITLTGASVIQYLTLSGTTVYASGSDISGNLAYWVDKTENSLGIVLPTNVGVSSYAVSGMTLSGTNVLVSGNLYVETNPPSQDTAAYGNFGLFWNNGNLKVFGPGISLGLGYNATAGVVALGNDIYMAGRLPDSTQAGGYWKNGVWNSINNGAFYPFSVAAFGSDLYIAGFEFTHTTPSYAGAYWNNGVLNTISNSSGIIAVTVSNSDVYTLGTDYSNNYVVWKNGVLFETLGSANSVSANCITIGN